MNIPARYYGRIFCCFFCFVLYLCFPFISAQLFSFANLVTKNQQQQQQKHSTLRKIVVPKIYCKPLHAGWKAQPTSTCIPTHLREAHSRTTAFKLVTFLELQMVPFSTYVVILGSFWPPPTVVSVLFLFSSMIFLHLLGFAEMEITASVIDMGVSRLTESEHFFKESYIIKA